MKYISTILYVLSPFLTFAQVFLTGKVQDKTGRPVFAANIYLKSLPTLGTITDFDGSFTLKINSPTDSLIISYLGFQTQEISLTNLDLNLPLVIILKENAQSLDEIIITGRDPISEHFSVVKMDMLRDVYFNPLAQGDPLKAITILPASTNTDETANPALRGSSPHSSRVVLNGVPIYNPVRATNLNNMGFFSLFNPEIIERQYVYASNPPLIYGNSSAGLVEIQTKNDIPIHQLQLSAGLAGIGVLLSQKIKKDRSLIQLYGNYQFSDAFIGVQKKKLPNLDYFKTRDGGINFHCKLGKQWTFNSLNYGINESYLGMATSFSYQGPISNAKHRFFTVNNFKHYSDGGVLSINSSIDFSKQSLEFGNLHTKQKTHQRYASIDYKKSLSASLSLQFGASYDGQSQNLKDSLPTFFYALTPNSPNHYSKTREKNALIESYVYGHWAINEHLALSTGLRSNWPMKNQDHYLSAQIGVKYKLSDQHCILFSGGKYHSYRSPTYFLKNYTLLSSNQIALDYTFVLENTLLKSATYFKQESGHHSSDNFLTVEKINTFGIEFYIEHSFLQYFMFSFSNSFIDQKRMIAHQKYHGPYDFNYLIKTAIQYSHPKLFTLALSYVTHPGLYYTEIVGSELDDNAHLFIPTFSYQRLNAQYGNYQRFDLSWSTQIPLKKQSFIVYASINNLLNSKNERAPVYSSDYSSKYFDYYQLRTFYVGLVYHMKY